MRRRALALTAFAFAYAVFAALAGCGTPTYYSTSVGYYGGVGWYDPYYYRPCCRGYGRPDHPHHPDHPHRPPGTRPPPGYHPPGHHPPGMRPPGQRPPGAGRPPSLPSRPRPTPRPAGRR